MEEEPEPAQPAKLVGVDRVEQVVSDDEHDGEGHDRRARQPHERRQHDHRRPDRPDHLQDENVGPDVEGPGHADDGDLEEDEPQAALGRKAASARVEASRRPCRYAAVPARSTNTGAQKCVTQRVK